MSPLQAIVKMRLESLRNQALNLRRDSLTKALVVFFGLGNVIGLGFWVSLESFRFVEKFPAFGSALNAKMISLLFFTLLILVTVSTLIVAYTTIYFGRETEFLFQHPTPPRLVLGVKLVEAIAFSSWATMFLFFPVLVSFGALRKAPPAYYVESFVILTVFLLFAGLLGTLLALALAPLIRRLSGRQLLLGAGGLVAILGWTFLRSFNIWSSQDERNDLLLLDRFMSQIATMQSPYFPGRWASSAVLAAAAGNHREALFQGCVLLANTLIFFPLLALYGKLRYPADWIAARDAAASSRKSRAPRERPGKERAPERSGWAASRIRARHPLGSLLWKDLLVFVRDPAQVSQSLLFALLMVVYSLSLIRVPVIRGEFELVVYFSNLAAVCMLLSSFTSRFIFPLVSLEGRAFWIVGLAPVSRSYLVAQKGIFGLAVSWLLGLATVTVSSASLGTSPGLFVAAVYTVVLCALSLTSLATGLGAAYPVFDEDNPARIAVGLGGTLNFFASALAVAVILGVEAAPYLYRGREPGSSWIFLSHTASLGITLGLSAFCFRLGARALARRDF